MQLLIAEYACMALSLAKKELAGIWKMTKPSHMGIWKMTEPSHMGIWKMTEPSRMWIWSFEIYRYIDKIISQSGLKDISANHI